MYLGRALFLAMIGLFGLLVGCGGPGSPTDIQIRIEPSEVSLAPEGSHEFTATVTGSDDDLVEWSATGGSIQGAGATVTYEAPAEAGEYTVTVTSTVDTTKSASAAVTVIEEGEDAVLGVSIIGGDRTLSVGETISLAVEVDVVGAASRAVVWSSDDTAVATVDVDGVLRGVAVGSTTITATSEADASQADAIEVVVEAVTAGARIEITSGSEVLLTGAGESITLTAVVYQHDGRIDPDAQVMWESHDPGVVSVDGDGVATALVDAGYVNVSASSAGLEPAVVSVAIAVPLEDTRIVDASKVLDIDVDASRVRMVRSAETEAIEVGDVVVSSAGLLAHVLAVTVSDDEVEIEFEVGELRDAFDRVAFSSSTGPVIIETVITDAGVSVQTSTADGAYVGRAALGIDALKCETEVGRPITVSLTGANIAISNELEAVFAFDSADPDVLQAYVSDSSRINATLGTIEVSVGGEITFSCAIKAPSIAIPAVTFFGLVSLTGDVTPSVGFEASAEYDGPQLKIQGPSIEAGVDWKAGVSYDTRTDEWATLYDYDEVFEASWGQVTTSLDEALAFYVGPFAQAEFGVSLRALWWNVAGVDVLKPKLSAGVGIDLPFGDRYASDYNGPDMALQAKLGVGVGLKLTGTLDKILGFLGIKAEVKLAGFTPFSVSFDMLPKPEVSALPRGGSGAYPFSASVPLDPAFKAALSIGRTLEFLAFADGDETGTVVGTATINHFGVAQTEWLPDVGVSALSSGVLSGDIRLVGLLYDPVFGSLNVPIRSRNAVDLFVPKHDQDAVVDIGGDDPTNGFDDPSLDALYSVLKAGLDTSEGTLRLSERTSTFPFIWIALSARGTIAKIDTGTGEVLGEYRTAPQGIGTNPSRTTVGLDGSVWAGNRNSGYVVHVGLREAGQCVDRNGDGVITTSSGYGDILPWPAGGDPVDECILHLVDHVGADARHVSVNADGNIWVGSYGGTSNRVFQLIDSSSGAIIRTEGPFGCGGYGGLIDRNGVLWSASSGSLVLRWDPDAPTVAGENPRCVSVPNYGLAVDNSGWIWVASFSGNAVWKVSPDGNTVLGPFSHGSSNAQGLAVDDRGHVWVSSSLNCYSGCTVGHLLNDGTYVGSVPAGAGSTGVAVDADGKVWTANIRASTATRIDPGAGPVGADGVTPIGAVDLTVPLPGANPYNYSDMTGRIARTITTIQGTWNATIDSEIAGYEWQRVVWQLKEDLPFGTGVEVKVRAADERVALGSLPYADVVNDADLSGIVGRFLQIEVKLYTEVEGESPEVTSIRLF